MVRNDKQSEKTNTGIVLDAPNGVIADTLLVCVPLAVWPHYSIPKNEMVSLPGPNTSFGCTSQATSFDH
jgi:hypothetical protein